ncbi:MAG: RNA polymerase sigma factor [Proteobacteria bacterium]|nr:RNA polymerase sigma factor [Pseudomonadota bacterium]
MPKTNRSMNKLSAVSAAFVENNLFLRKFLSRYFSDEQDIEDVAQEAYLRAYIAEKKKEIEQPKAFLFRIARNVALTKLTKKSKQIPCYIEESTASEVIEVEASTDEVIEAQELLGLYCEAVAMLPDKCREVFLLRKVHGLAHKEIAVRMSLSISSVEKYLRQGVLACKGYVRKHEEQTQHTGKDIDVQGIRGKIKQ